MFNTSNLELTYFSKGKRYKMIFDAGFIVNGELIITNYDRYDSPYCKGSKKADSIIIEFNGKYLHLDFYKMTRDFTGSGI